jgi:predicted NAD-dependent protein-ADP-ribosyltransferase YbiA (DUF1768 family)
MWGEINNGHGASLSQFSRENSFTTSTAIIFFFKTSNYFCAFSVQMLKAQGKVFYSCWLARKVLLSHYVATWNV